MLKTGQLQEMWVVASQTHLQFNMVGLVARQSASASWMVFVCLCTQHFNALQVVFMGCCLLLAVMAVAYVLTRTKPVYLMNYYCYKAPDRSVPLFHDFVSNEAAAVSSALACVFMASRKRL